MCNLRNTVTPEWAGAGEDVCNGETQRSAFQLHTEDNEPITLSQSASTATPTAPPCSYLHTQAYQSNWKWC